jgi:hypothetical protein
VVHSDASKWTLCHPRPLALLDTLCRCPNLPNRKTTPITMQEEIADNVSRSPRVFHPEIFSSFMTLDPWRNRTPHSEARAQVTSPFSSLTRAAPGR